MPRKRRSYPAELKAKVAVEALREEATMAELDITSIRIDDKVELAPSAVLGRLAHVPAMNLDAGTVHEDVNRSVMAGPVERDLAESLDRIFAVRTEDGPVVKRLRHDADGWWLVSENEAYAPRPWPADAAVLGQVMWTGRTL